MPESEAVALQEHLEAMKPDELISKLRQARSPIVREGYCDTENLPPVEAADPAKVGDSQALDALESALRQMRESSMVQLEAGGLTPKQTEASAQAEEGLDEKARRLAELLEGLGGSAQTASAADEDQGADEPPFEWAKDDGRDQLHKAWDEKSEDEKNADLTEWYRRWQEGEEPKEWQKALLKQYNIWTGENPPSSPPQDQEESEEVLEVEGQSASSLGRWVRGIDWGNVAREGMIALGPAVLTAGVWEAFPQSHQAVEHAVAAGLGIGTLLTVGGEAVRRVSELHPRLSRIAAAAAGTRSVGLLLTQISASAGVGFVAAEIADRVRSSLHLLSTPVSVEAPVSGGELPHPSGAVGGNVDNPSQWPTSGTGPRVGGGTGGGESGLPIPDGGVSDGGTLAGGGGGAVVEVVSPLAEAGRNLVSGTVWGNELDFAKQLHISHPTVAANALKNLAYGLKQTVEFTRLGPDSMVNLVSRDAAAKIAEAASNLVGRDPSSLTGIQKALWEIAVSSRYPTGQEATDIIAALTPAH